MDWTTHRHLIIICQLIHFHVIQLIAFIHLWSFFCTSGYPDQERLGDWSGLGSCVGNVRSKKRRIELATVTHQGPPTSDPRVEATDLRCFQGIWCYI